MSENLKKPLASPCGVDCDVCKDKEACKGSCFQSEGKVCYIVHTGLEICPIYDCAIHQKAYKSCAECKELPCQKFFDWKEPCRSDEEHREQVKQRVATLQASR